LMTFEDEDGYRLGLVLDSTPSYRPDREPLANLRWALVDDNYPKSVGGALGDLLEQSAD